MVEVIVAVTNHVVSIGRSLMTTVYGFRFPADHANVKCVLHPSDLMNMIRLAHAPAGWPETRACVRITA
jgi:hypothetical protein